MNTPYLLKQLRSTKLSTNIRNGRTILSRGEFGDNKAGLLMITDVHHVAVLVLQRLLRFDEPLVTIEHMFDYIISRVKASGQWASTQSTHGASEKTSGLKL